MELESRPTRVMVVEDNNADVTILRCALEELGDWPVNLTIVGDGEKAIKLIQESLSNSDVAIDLVILDLNLPLISGSDVLKWIRTASGRPALPTLILSSCPQDVSIQRVSAQGLKADGYYEKPADFDSFIALLAEIRRCHQASPSGSVPAAGPEPTANDIAGEEARPFPPRSQCLGPGGRLPVRRRG